MESLHIVDTLSINQIVWIRSLPDDELGPSRRMVEDVEMLSVSGGFQLEEASVTTADEMLQFLESIAIRTRDGLRPILHFDCHGDADEGLAMANGERLAWDLLADGLRQINIATCNNLVCVFATCFGLHLGKTLRLSEASPWYLMIAPENEVTLETLEAKTRPFYEAVTASGNITQAYVQSFAPELQLFNCQGLFARSLARYVAQHGGRAAIDRRTENLVTRSLQEKGQAANRHNLRKERSRIKVQLKLNQATVDRYAATFLIGRKPGVTLPEIKRLAAAERKRPTTLS